MHDCGTWQMEENNRRKQREKETKEA